MYIWELHLFHFTNLWEYIFVIKWSSWRKSAAIKLWMPLYLLDQRYVFVLGYAWLPWGAWNRLMRWHLLQMWGIWALGECMPSILQHLKHSMVILVQLCIWELLLVSQASLTFRHKFWFGFVMKYSSQRVQPSNYECCRTLHIRGTCVSWGMLDCLEYGIDVYHRISANWKLKMKT